MPGFVKCKNAFTNQALVDSALFQLTWTPNTHSLRGKKTFQYEEGIKS